MPMDRGLRWATGEVEDIREKTGSENNITEKWQADERKINRNIGR